MILELLHRRTIRIEEDVNDKSTVVSIYPGEVIQNHVTISPGYFQVKAGTFEHPSVLVVGSSSWWKDTGPDEPLIEIPHRSIAIAKSIVMDWCNGLIGFNGEQSMPGLFYVQGEFTAAQIKSRFGIELVNARSRQINWFRELLKQADSLWARSNGNPLAVADLMKMAARELNQDRPWLKDYALDTYERCIACGAMKPTSAVVCVTCKVITNPAKAKELGLTFVQ